MIQVFYNLPQEEQQKFQAAWKHLPFLMVLWGLDDLSTDHTLVLEEKRHAMLAYRYLEMLWFYRLSKTNKKPVKLYIRDRLQELTICCRSIRSPKWLTRNIKAVTTSIEALPYEAS